MYRRSPLSTAENAVRHLDARSSVVGQASPLRARWRYYSLSAPAPQWSAINNSADHSVRMVCQPALTRLVLPVTREENPQDMLSQLVEHRQSDSRDIFEGTAVRFESGQRPHALDRDDEKPRQRRRILLARQFAA